MKRVEEFKDILTQMFRSDLGSDPMKLIELVAEDMAWSEYDDHSDIPAELIERCKASPLTKRLKEAGLW